MGRKLGAKEGTNFGGLSRFCESNCTTDITSMKGACDSQILKKTIIRIVRNTQAQIAKIISFRKKTRQTSSCHDFWAPICIFPKLKIYTMVLHQPSRGEVKWLDTKMENDQLWSSNSPPISETNLAHEYSESDSDSDFEILIFSTKLQILLNRLQLIWQNPSKSTSFWLTPTLILQPRLFQSWSIFQNYGNCCLS